ncbi:MAG: hypothetical protein JWN46_226 [Acidimicrobiales bacterium]|nr:hypothetical protein [Acidimicrobiales bacterium]
MTDVGADPGLRPPPDDADRPAAEPEPEPEPAPASGEAGQPPDRTARGAPSSSRAEQIAFVAFLVIIAIAVTVPSWGRFAPDTRPDLYQQPGRLLKSTLQAWVGGGSGLGQGNFNTGTAPVAAVVWVIRSLGAPAWLAVRIWRFLLLVVAALGIRRYLGVLFGDRLTVVGRSLATVFWLVNPYVIVGANTTPVLLPYALLPWTLLAFVHAARNPRSWRWPAAFALAFFAQTGLNAGVVPLFGLVALPAHVLYLRMVEGTRWRDLGRVLVRCAVLTVAVSLYWLLPSLFASGTGAGIAATTESPRDVARPSSYAEVSRLLGNWPLYGRSGSRLFIPEFAGYLTNPFMVVASFLVPAGAALAVVRTRARERLLGALLLAFALPVMVGIFPPDNPPPWGRLIRATFDRVPASLAFRTTNKAGLVVALGETVLLAVGAGAWLRRWQRVGVDRRRQFGAAALVGLILVVAGRPLWFGGLYPGSYRIPAYWKEATAQLDRRDRASRVLVVPGGGGNYRWGVRSPDDLFPSLMARPVAVRSTVVGAGDPAANFMAGFDTMLALGSLPPGALSTVARYLGASDVLVRSDLLTEETGGAAPWVVTDQVRADTGLTAAEAYGELGQHTLPGTAASGSDARVGPAERAADPQDAALPPVQLFRVNQPQPVVRTVLAASQVVVDGDGAALPGMATLHIVDGRQPVRLLGEFTDADLSTAALDGAGFVLTDTNRRRAADINRVANATSPTLAATQPLNSGNGASLTLWPTQPDRQSVTEVVGARSIDASRPAFGLRPFGKPTYAFDGNPFSAWTTGEFGTAAGQFVQVRFDQPRTVSQFTLQLAPGGPSRIDQVGITTDTGRYVQAVPETASTVTVNLPPSVTSALKVEILHQTPGNNAVGLSEITLPQFATAEVVRLPTTYDDLVRRADAATRSRVAQLPLDIVLERAAGSTADPNDDEETQIARRVQLPQARQFTLHATIPYGELDPKVRDAVFTLGAGQQAPCQVVGFVDRSPLRARVTSRPGDLAPGRPATIEGCEPIQITAGSHGIATAFGWRLDRIQLHSTGTSAPAAPVSPLVTIVSSQATRDAFDVPPTAGPYYVRLGQAFDARWRLSMDGVDQGPPLVLDGYSSGWRISDTGAHRFVASFPGQQSVRGAFVISAAAVIGVVGLVTWPAEAWPPAWFVRRRRSWRPTRRATVDEAVGP